MNNEITPEKKHTDAVLDAFSEADSKTNEDFRNRWNSTVAQAQKRKEERLRTEDMRAKEEEERRQKAQREAYLRSKHEAPPGIPLNLSELAQVIKRRAEAPSVAAEEPQKPKVEPETDSFLFFAEAATVAEKAMGNQKNLYFPLPCRRDRKRKKSFSESLYFRMRTRLSKDGFKRFAKRNFPVKGEPASEITRKTVRAVSFVALVFAFVFLGNYYVDFVKRIDTTQGYEETMSSLSNVPPEKLGDEWERIKALYPDITFPHGMNIKFSELYAINQNVVGWLKVDNTKINTVLLQAENNTYHLKHNIYGEYTRFGNPYVHYACKMGNESLSKNTILYGHNANDGLMFHDLINYMTVEGFKKSPVVTLDTLYEQTKWKVFAVVLTNSHPSEDNGRVWTYLYPEFSSQEHFVRVLGEIDERTIIKTGVDVLPTDKILTLYTCCTYQLESGRLAVFARQVREGESEETDLSKVRYNSNPRYPQEWYKRKGITNPFGEPEPSSTKGENPTSGGSPTAQPSRSPEPSSQAPVSQEPSSQPPASGETEQSLPATEPSTGTPPSTQASEEPSAELSEASAAVQEVPSATGENPENRE